MNRTFDYILGGLFIAVPIVGIVCSGFFLLESYGAFDDFRIWFYALTEEGKLLAFILFVLIIYNLKK